MTGNPGRRQGTRSSIAARAAVTLLVLGAVSMWTPNAWTAPEAKTAVVETGMEAWYHVLADTSVIPAPLPVTPDPVNPYAENTLHVGITGGEEDSRTYITLDTEKLGFVFTLVDGILELPVDPADGTREPKTARIQVCASDLPTEEVEGSFEQPPKVDCDTASSRAVYKDKPYPRFLVDLNPFKDELGLSGLAIVPSSRAAAEADTWHVAFYAKKNKTEGATPISAEITYLPDEGLDLPPVTPPPADDFDSDSDTDDFDSDFDTGGGFAFDSGAPPSDFGAGTNVPSTESSTTSSAPVALTDTQTLAQPTTLVQPTYTIVWSLPLVLLALSLYFGSALTRDVTRKMVGGSEK